jgi:putative lipoic acid-binding regulatory protein
LNNYSLFSEYIKLWQNYNRFWIESYFDFFNGYTNWTKKWLWYGKNLSINHAFGVVNMVDDVDVVGSSITGDRQITVVLRYSGKGNSPNVAIEVGAMKFEFQEFPLMYKDLMKNMMSENTFSNFNKLDQDTNEYTMSYLFKNPSELSGSSKIMMGWSSPNAVMVNLNGNSTLNELNLIGIRIHN